MDQICVEITGPGGSVLGGNQQAFVYAWLGDNDLMAVRTEAEKYLMLGALNLVECVAFVGAVEPTR